MVNVQKNLYRPYDFSMKILNHLLNFHGNLAENKRGIGFDELNQSLLLDYFGILFLDKFMRAYISILTLNLKQVHSFFQTRYIYGHYAFI